METLSGLVDIIAEAVQKFDKEYHARLNAKADEHQGYHGAPTQPGHLNFGPSRGTGESDFWHHYRSIDSGRASFHHGRRRYLGVGTSRSGSGT